MISQRWSLFDDTECELCWLAGQINPLLSVWSYRVSSSSLADREEQARSYKPIAIPVLGARAIKHVNGAWRADH